MYISTILYVYNSNLNSYIKEYLSGIEIIHRDLACRNVLVGYQKLLKITDFGLSREVEESNYLSSSVHLPIRWLAPECFSEKKFSEKSDVYVVHAVCLNRIFY